MSEGKTSVSRVRRAVDRESEADAQAAAAAALKAPSASMLTNAERLLIARRRKRERKDQAAKRWRVSLYEYQRWESGDAEPLAREDRKAAPASKRERTAPRVGVGALEFFEWAMVLRRRSGETVKQRATRMGVTPWWLSQMELGEAPDGALRRWVLEHEAGSHEAVAARAKQS